MEVIAEGTFLKLKTMVYPCGFHLAHFVSSYSILLFLLYPATTVQIKVSTPHLSDLESFRTETLLCLKSCKLKLMTSYKVK